MTIHYSVDHSFGLRQLNGQNYIESNNFSAKIKHNGLKQFLDYLQKNKITKMTQTELGDIATEYKVNREALADFLVVETGLFKVNINEKSFSSLAVFGEGCVIESLCAAFDGNFRLSVHHMKTGQQVCTDNTVIIYYSPLYDPKQIKELYASSSCEGNYFVTSYLLGEYLMIDNIFSRQSGLPCHFCHYERLKSNSHLIPKGQNKSWLSYYRDVLNENTTGIFERALPPIYENYIAYCLYQFVRRLVDPFSSEWHYDQYTHFWNVHLEKMSISKEAASFWPFCSCKNK